MSGGTSSPDCKHKHMLEAGAPPDKFGVLYRLLHTEFHVTAGSMFLAYYTLFPDINSFFYRQNASLNNLGGGGSCFFFREKIFFLLFCPTSNFF